MSVSSEGRPHEAVDSGGLPITRDSETTVPSQPITHDTSEPEVVTLPATTMTDTAAAQEAKGAGAEYVVNIPAEVRTICSPTIVPSDSTDLWV